MASLPRLCTRSNEHSMSHTAETATSAPSQSWWNQYCVGAEFVRPMENGQRGCVKMITLGRVPRRTWWWTARSHLLPSSRTGLFAVGEHLIPQSLVGEKRHLLLLGVGITAGASDTAVLAKESSPLPMPEG